MIKPEAPGMGLTMKEKKDVTTETAKRYCICRKKEKKAILDEFTNTTGYNRKYAVTVLNKAVHVHTYTFNNCRKKTLHIAKKETVKRVYKKQYDEQVQNSLIKIWKFFDFQCGQRLVPLIRANIESIEKCPEFDISAASGVKLRNVSSATVDRLLKQERNKYKAHGISTTRPAKNFNQLIPIRVYYDWDERRPGIFETDTVSHDGGNASGEYCFTLTATDICTQWTELRALKNKAQCWTKKALEDIRISLPYRLDAIHPDNGSEFKNAQVFGWAQEHHIDYSRSRSYHKNDNCFVEQKNDSLVRRAVGYYRYEGDNAREALEAVYSRWCLLNNFFYPSMRIISKNRVDAKVMKKYDKAKTPYERVLENDSIRDCDKENLRQQKSKLNIVELRKEMNTALDRLLPFAVKWKCSL
jgi:hypothetical protein